MGLEFGLGYASKYVGFECDDPDGSLVARYGSSDAGDLSFSRLKDKNDELLRGTRCEDPVLEPNVWGRERTDCMEVDWK
jgi:hypothetical protein